MVTARSIALAVALGAAAPAPATAGEPTAAATARLPRAWIGVKAGALLPQAFTPLGTNLVVDAEAGLVLPFGGGHLEVMAWAAYAQPPADGASLDARVPGGAYDWSITQRELSVAVAGVFRLQRPSPSARLAPYVGLGPKLYFLQTKANGAAAGQPFGEYSETSTELGGTVLGGVDYRVGPGTVVGELEVGLSDLDHLTTGDASTGSVEVKVGYRFWF